MRELTVEMAGHKLLLLADKALYWPSRKLLCLADVHFGKAAAYRAWGQPVPHGTTAANLLRRDSLLTRYPINQVMFLGDFLHAPRSHAPVTLAALHERRQRHPALACKLVRGNHDLRAGDPPASLEIEVVNEPLFMLPFALRHMPIPLAGYHVIAGHLHPVFHLHGRGRQRLRLCCFHSTDDLTVLPAFGDFTGGHVVEKTPGSRIVVTDRSGVWSVGAA